MFGRNLLCGFAQLSDGGLPVGLRHPPHRPLGSGLGERLCRPVRLRHPLSLRGRRLLLGCLCHCLHRRERLCRLRLAIGGRPAQHGHLLPRLLEFILQLLHLRLQLVNALGVALGVGLGHRDRRLTLGVCLTQLVHPAKPFGTCDVACALHRRPRHPDRPGARRLVTCRLQLA